MSSELPATTIDIKVDWLNEVLHENGFLGASNIISVNRELMGEGKGFHSDMARLYLTYDKEPSILPNTMIAKLPTHSDLIPRFVINTVFEKEINFYTEIAPKSPIRVPEIMFADMQPAEEKYVVLMEDCGNYEEADPELKGLSYKQARIITEKIAAFHARWWNADELSFLKVIAINNPANNDAGRYRGTWNTCTKLSDFKTVLPEGGWDAGLKIYEKGNQLWNTSPPKNPTICYCDFKPDNMFFDWKTPGNPLIILDWGLTSIGEGSHDLAIMVGFNLPIETRREHEKELVSIYHDQLLKNGVSEYSYDECWEDYIKGLMCMVPYPLLLFSLRDENNEKRINTFSRQAVSRWFSAIVDNDATSLLT